MKKNILFTIIGLSTLFVSCTKNIRKNENNISVVATTFPVYDAVRAVGGDFIGNQISLKLLVKPGSEVHSYDPSPADIIAIQNSDLFIYIGGESDEWVEKILKSSEKSLKSEPISLIEKVKTVFEPEFDEEDDDLEHETDHHESRNEHHHEHDEINEHEIDEHIWTSPENEIIIVKTVCDSLVKIAEEKNHSELCESLNNNAADYINEINKLIEETKKIVESKAEPFILMADRFPFIYFTNFYGLTYDAAFSGCSTAVEANTKTISRLIDTVKQKKLTSIFYIELGNHKIADSIAESTGTKTILLQSCQNVTKNDFDNGETWLSLMKYNTEALNIGLR